MHPVPRDETGEPSAELPPTTDYGGAPLANWDEALTAGNTPEPLGSGDAPPELRRDLAFVQRLRRALGPADAAPAPTAAPPAATLGRFQVRRELGRGGFGVVFLAHDPALGRAVALKVPRAEVLLTGDWPVRFQREAEVAASLDHPNLVPVYEAGAEGEVCFLVSAYCPGPTLAHWLIRHREPVPFRDAAALVATLADAVDHAHARGVLHRDLKPGNVLLTGAEADQPEGHPLRSLAEYTPKITDFGLAKVFASKAGQEKGGARTQSGAIVGTANYMAPEQAEGRNKELGPAADVYGLGAMLYELLTGRPPFQGETDLETLLMVQADEPVPPARLRPKVPRDLETVCLKCLEKEPGRRYVTAGDLAADLRRFLAGEPVRARPAGRLDRALKWVRRHPAQAAAYGLLVLVLGLGLGGGGVVWLWQGAEAAKQGEAAAREQLADALDRLAQTSYFRQIDLAYRDWKENDLARAVALLEACSPERRGWEWYYVHRLCYPSVLTLKGHTARVQGVCFSPDGRRLASASHDGTVRVWDPATGQEVITLQGRTVTGQEAPIEKRDVFVNAVCFSPDGKRLASASVNGPAKVWDTATGQELLTLKGYGGVAWSVCFSADGKRLAGAYHDKTVRVWDAATGQEALTLQGHTDLVNSVCFSPDGKRLASAQGDFFGPGEVKVWDAATGQEALTLKGHTSGVRSVCFSPDGKRLASASFDKTVRVWDAVTGQETLTLSGHNLPTTCVCFSPDGRWLASASDDRTVKVWEAATGKEALGLKGHTGAVMSVCFSPDGRRLASASWDQTVRVWDTAIDQEVLILKGSGTPAGYWSVCLSPDGRRLAGAANGRMKVWDLATGQEVLTFQGDTLFLVNDVCFSPDGRRLATASEREVRVWDAATGQEALTFKWHTRELRSVCFSPDGRHLASGSEVWDEKKSRYLAGEVKVWDAATGREVLSLQGHTASGNDQYLLYGPNPSGNRVCFSPDSRLLASALDRTVKIWDMATGQEVITLQGHTQGVGSICFSPDGKRLASTSLDGTVKVWDLATGQEALSLKEHTYGVQSVCFSPDGQRLASASVIGVKIWDMATGQEVITLQGHPSGVIGVCFSPDGNRLVSAWTRTWASEIDILVRVWVAATDQEIARSEVARSKR